MLTSINFCQCILYSTKFSQHLSTLSTSVILCLHLIANVTFLLVHVNFNLLYQLLLTPTNTYKYISSSINYMSSYINLSPFLSTFVTLCQLLPPSVNFWQRMYFWKVELEHICYVILLKIITED